MKRLTQEELENINYLNKDLVIDILKARKPKQVILIKSVKYGAEFTIFGYVQSNNENEIVINDKKSQMPLSIQYHNIKDNIYVEVI